LKGTGISPCIKDRVSLKGTGFSPYIKDSTRNGL
jgi:hypothetical protein